MPTPKHLLNQMIKREPSFKRRLARTDRMDNEIGDGSYHVSYDVFDIPGTTTRVSPASGSESIYVKYCKDADEFCLDPITVRYSHHDNNATRFGEQIDGRNGRKSVLDEILYKMGKAKPVFEEKTYHRRNALHEKVPKEELVDIDIASIPTHEQMLNGRRFPDESDIGTIYRSQRGIKRIKGFDDWEEKRKVFKGFDIPEDLKYLYDMDFLGGLTK